MSRRGAAFLALAALAGFAPAAAVAQPAPAVAPASAVQVVYGEWTDPARGGRVVPFKAYVPQGDGPFPVVVHSHGLGGSREASVFLLQAVAEAGFLVVCLQHAGSDTGILAGGRPTTAGVVAAGGAAINPQVAQARYGDLPFALDQIARDPRLAAKADMSRIGMSGHSYGALSTLVAVGQRVPGATPQTRFAEQRIRAAVAYSPNKPRGDDPKAAFAAVKTPMLHFTGTADVTPFDLEKTPFERTTPFQAIQGPDQFLIVLDGADHGLFGGRRGTGGVLKPTDPPQMEIVKAETIRFWRAYLTGDAVAARELCDLPGRIDPAGDGYAKAKRCGPPTPIAPVDGLR
ncbi:MULTISPECIES: hypothetical protein [unclassified Phenylobacterium]|uniref:alpha/beta hydrolase family protein n=1 Tax=unclassified Phenylobacterium TaxID=2640670 RepID=UPI00083A2AD2|nr:MULTISPECIES: hypothetical protein [unclassified Phenylobacterium]